nr:SEC14-like protein 2 [Rhipicephalus microplus]
MANDAKEQAALEQLKEALKDVWQEQFTDAYLMRWLRARDLDVAKADDLLRKNLQWREKNKVDTLVERYECHPIVKQYFPGGIFNHDRDGSPIYIIPIGSGDFKGMLQCLSKEELVIHVVYMLERLQRERESQSRKLGKLIDKSVFFFDWENFSLRQVYSWQVVDYIRALVGLYENNYPETLKLGLLVNTPSFFPVFWKLIRPFLSERTAGKIKIFSKDGWLPTLLEYVDPSQLPAQWGGTIVHPEGGARCTHIIGPGGDLPDAVSRGGGALAVDPEAVSCFLERGRSMEVPVQVEVPGAKLHWRLQAKDVGFALWRVSGEDRVQVLAPRRIACDKDPEYGQMHCEHPGTYTFTFDNSFSWFNGKQLSYVIRVHHESIASPDDVTRC